MKTLAWFRNDLRLHDNEMLTAAVSKASESTTFLYVHDGRFDARTPEGTRRNGEFRQRFLAETLCDLRASLNQIGAELVCLTGAPAAIIPEFCRESQVTDVFYSRCTSFDERADEHKIKQGLGALGIRTHAYQTETMITDEDVKDFDLYRPMSFSKLRSFVEKTWPVRPPLPVPKILKTAPRASLGPGFKVWEFTGHLNSPVEPGGVHLHGGETAALARVEAYFWQGDHLRSYKETRNGLLNLNDSSKFSPALAAGCLSPRFIYHEVRRYERQRIANSSTLWFLYELLWRDYFRFLALGRAHRLFTDEVEPAGVAGSLSPRSGKLFADWCAGETGSRFVDAAMIELKTTGWLSNRMRQVTASYLIHDLQVNWKMGARWFETCLVDYDACSNWGNWSYIAGAGPMNRPHVFDVTQQERMYDPQGAYQDHWAR